MKKNYFSRISVILFIFMLVGSISSFAQNKYAISLDGNESFYVNDDASNNLDLTGSYTFECWFNLDSYQQYDRLFDRRTVCAMSIMAANGSGDFALRFTERGSTHNVLRTLETDAAHDMTLDTWYHVAATYDATTHDAKLYINGDLAASANSSYWSLSASTNALNIGGLYNSSYSNQIDAHIDEIRVSNIARNISNMQSSTHWEEYSSDGNTVLLMHLNDKGNPPTYISGNGLTGTTGDDDITDADYVDSRIGSPDYLLRPKYRSQATGNWSSLSTWETENGVDTYVDATIIPGFYTETIAIESGHTVTVDNAIVANNLEIKASANLTISSQKSLTIEGTLTNNAGNSGLIVKADASGNGSLIESNGVSATIEQHLSADAWHLVSLPIASAQASAYNGLYLYEWVEADSAFTGINSTSYGLSATHGYYAYSSSGISSPTDVSFAGNINTGDKAVTWMTYNAQGYTGQDGWNLVGNPYASGLTWDNTWSQSNLDATVMYLMPEHQEVG
ncbi:MAG: LamG domain-containing protein [Chlorobi bacterium]|nr:LamG domain-containing protein [Chlorobiota bacterium]